MGTFKILNVVDDASEDDEDSSSSEESSDVAAAGAKDVKAAAKYLKCAGSKVGLMLKFDSLL